MTSEERKQLRKSKIQARDQLAPKQREIYSRQIVEHILGSKAFQEAQTIMIYRAVKGEVRLDTLEETAIELGKRLVYPLCISNHEMIALQPRKDLTNSQSAWKSGDFGIPEPMREFSIEIAPEEIDLVICPCTVFDEAGGRMGMGAGFYDRYLKRCMNAHVAAAAFEVQKTDKVPMEVWDRKMDLIFTESQVYIC